MSHQTYQYNTSWEKVARLFPVEKGLRILDLGCGDGRLVKHLVADHQVFGVDASLEGVAQAQANGVQAVHANVNDTSMPWESDLDVVLALDILEHLEQPSAVLTKIKTSLKPTGQLILALPNHFDLRTRLEILGGRGIIKW